jgi:hypothetical protein
MKTPSSPPIVSSAENCTSVHGVTTTKNTCKLGGKINTPQGRPRSSSADRIRSRFLHKIGIDSPATNSPQGRRRSQSVGSPLVSNCATGNDFAPASSSIKECILRLEPLKIALESDDDSSIGSQASSFDDDDQTRGSSHSDPDHDLRFHYFHKKPHSNNEEISTKNQEVVSISLDAQLQENSLNSLPSLAGSDESNSVITPPLSSSNHSNKKARFLEEHTLENVPRKKKKGVSIHKSVSVVSIPSRLEYSNRARERIWTTAGEIQKNAARNTIEFCSESWRWQNVIEDEHMFMHRMTKELVHPIHVQNALTHIQSFGGDNNEEVQLNLHLISSLVPPAAAVKTNPSSEIGHCKDKELPTPPNTELPTPPNTAL